MNPSPKDSIPWLFSPVPMGREEQSLAIHRREAPHPTTYPSLICDGKKIF